MEWQSKDKVNMTFGSLFCIVHTCRYTNTCGPVYACEEGQIGEGKYPRKKILTVTFITLWNPKSIACIVPLCSVFASFICEWFTEQWRMEMIGHELYCTRAAQIWSHACLVVCFLLTFSFTLSLVIFATLSQWSLSYFRWEVVNFHVVEEKNIYYTILSARPFSDLLIYFESSKEYLRIFFLAVLWTALQKCKHNT